MKSSIAVLFTILLGVVLAVYVSLKPTNSTPVDPRAASMRLLPLAADDVIIEIKIEHKGEPEPIVLERVNDRWQFTRPVAYPADPLIANGLVSAMTLSSKARRLVREKEWKEYGLEVPSLRVTLKTRKGLKPRVLAFGDLTPVGDYHFARWEGESEYFLLNSNLKKIFHISIYALRDKKIFREAMKKISHIYIRTQSGNYEISKHGTENRWFWMEPIMILGDVVKPEFVTAITQQLGELYVKDFLDEEKRDKGELGFSLMGNAVKVWGEDKNPEVLSLGGEVTTRDSFYGIREGEGTYFLMARNNILTLFKTMEGFAKESMPASSGTAKRKS